MNTVKVKKRNRIKQIPTGRLEAHLKQGYDQINDDGKVLKRATGGKNIPLAEHNKVLDELKELKNSSDNDAVKELELLKEEYEVLKKENATLKGKVTKLENATKEVK